MSKHHPPSTAARSLSIALTLALWASVAAWAQISLPTCSGNLPQFSVCEIVLTANATGNGFQPSIDVTATFTLAGTSTVKTVKGFYDGNGTGNRAIFRVRFNVSHLNGSNPGSWSYTTSSTDAGLNGKTGSFTSVGSGNRGFLRRAGSGAPGKFVFDSGARFFMWGQTYYQIVRNVSENGGWQQAVTQSLGKNLTKVRMLLYPFERPGPYEDSQPFTDTSHTILNLTHWKKFDEAVKFMNDNGMISDVILFNDNARTFASPLGSTDGRAMDKKYVRYAIARYAAFPNVIWCLTNEWELSAAPYKTDKAYWTDLGTTIRNEDPWMNQSTRQRPLSIHNKPNHSFKFFTDAWPVYAIVQDGIKNGGEVCPPSSGTTANPHFNNGDEWGNYSICNNLGHSMPVANDEYGYISATNCGSSYTLTRVQHRQVVWGIAVAGGYGSTGDAKVDAITGGQPVFWAGWADAPEYNDISRMVTFFTGRVTTWWLMSRDAAVVSATGCTPTANRVYALSQVGVRYVIYAAKGGTFTLNLPAPYGAATYKVYRIDPRNYDPVTHPGTLLSNVGGGQQTFTMPSGPDWAQDWVLLIEV